MIFAVLGTTFLFGAILVSFPSSLCPGIYSCFGL
jgi:hypothetical protein